MGTMRKNQVRFQQVMVTEGNCNPVKRLFTVEEASVYLGRTPWGVRELVYAGKIPFVRSGRKMFFDLADLDAFVQKNKTQFHRL